MRRSFSIFFSLLSILGCAAFAPPVSIHRVPRVHPRATIAAKWVQNADKDGRPFYHDPETGESVWELPGESTKPLPPTTSADDNLPAPWLQYANEDGKLFYHNPETGESVWELPKLGAPAGPAPPPPAAPAPAPSVPVSASPPVSPPSPPAPPPSAPATVAAATSDDLKAKLLTLVRRLPDRGAAALQAEYPPWEVEAVLQCVAALEPLDPAARDGWMYSDAWGDAGAPWALRYTSSRTFHRNEGATGYACLRPEVSTPELYLTVDQPRRNWITLVEPVLRSDTGSVADDDVMTAECLWSVGANDVLKMEPQVMRDPSGRETSPRDPNEGDEVSMDAEKAIRVMAALRPVYLDSSLLVMRSAVLEDTVFVWTRKGAKDPPEVDVGAPEEDSSAMPTAVARALAQRDAAAAKKIGFIRSGNIYGPGSRP